MSSGKVIDANGHIIARSDELRHYLKAVREPDSATPLCELIMTMSTITTRKSRTG